MVVLDAGAVAGLILPLPFSEHAAATIRRLCEAREELLAPALLEYEVCSVLGRAAARRILPADRLEQALELLHDLRIQSITPAPSLHVRALDWATKLGQAKAYDAQYLALAEEMNCPLLTADLRLVRTAQSLGDDWVRGLE